MPVNEDRRLSSLGEVSRDGTSAGSAGGASTGGATTGPEMRTQALAKLAHKNEACRRCPRLVQWREQVARERRAAFADERYAAHPVTGFGDPGARVLVLGLAPAAHGGNRTGRIFTGDRSGDFLFAAMWRAGFANQPTSTGRDDGLEIHDAWVAAAVRCAPPANRPLPAERDACLPWSVAELDLLPDIRVALCLGAFAWDAALRLRAQLADPPAALPRPRPRFAHGAEHPGAPFGLIGCFHPSQQNTFTGKLTPAMIDAVLVRARDLADLPAGPTGLIPGPVGRPPAGLPGKPVSATEGATGRT